MGTSHIEKKAPEGSPYTRHIPALDGIRGFAVLGVACSHLFPATPHSYLERVARTALSFGANGVDLFFVLSGFLITGILYDSLPDPAFFRKFYARRVLRIFPLYYGVLAIFAVAAPIFGFNYHHELLSLAFYLQNTTLIAERIRSYIGPSQLPLSHFWSLAIEEQFYLVWPVTIFLLRKRSRILVFCATALVLCPLLRLVLLLHGANYFVIASNTLCRADSLLAGGALALLLRGRFHDRVLRVAPWTFLAGAGVFLTLDGLAAHGLLRSFLAFTYFLSFSFSAAAIASTGFIALSLRSPLVRGMCSLRPMRWLGKYSYGIYVLHLVIFSYLDEPMRHFISTHITPDRGPNILLNGVLIFGISIIAAYGSYNLYEKPFLRLKRFFDYRPHANTAR